ncbi:MAG TPA: NUDIX hydrolase [Nitrospiria bacterium]|nr:NUDIX hydrolase [Nitrospiria bacterium]
MDLEEKLIRKKGVYDGKYIRAEEWVVRLPNGVEAVREIVTPPNAVGILPIDERGEVFLVRQFRPAIGKITIEIPAGIFEPGEAPEETARRECEEEIKMKPGRLDFLLSYFHSVGFSTGRIQLYLARDLTSRPDAPGDPGEFLEVIKIPIEALYRKIADREVIDSKTLLAVFWYRHLFER